MVSVSEELAFYAAPGRMTDLSGLRDELEGLPSDIAELCRVVQGLILHPFWTERYGVDVADERRGELQIPPAQQILEAALKLDDAPLTQARPPDRRVLGNCRDFSTVLCAMLRHRGVPARARCGFGTYFERGKFIDHWVVEHSDGDRWTMTDAQIDDLQRSALELSFDPLNVPRDAFVDAGRGWQMVRAGDADGDRFGVLDMFGTWFVRANVLRDLASLNKVEMLPWDAWGLIDGEPPRDDDVDAVASVSTAARFDEVRGLYSSDDRLRVPDEITSYTPAGPVRVAL